MVDFTKRADKAAGSRLGGTETMLAGTNVTPVPFQWAGSAATGGAIAGGLVGAAIGATVDKRRELRHGEEAARSLPDLASRPQASAAVPANGALLGVTDQRLLAWKISGLGKPKDLLFEIPFPDIDRVAWHEADTKWLGGSPRSTLIWIGLTDGTVIPVAAISFGPGGKYAGAVMSALIDRLGGKVTEFSGD